MLLYLYISMVLSTCPNTSLQEVEYGIELELPKYCPAAGLSHRFVLFKIWSKKRNIRVSCYRMRIRKVSESSFLPHELPVHHHGEVHIQNAVIVDGEAQYDPDQRELTFVLKWWGVKPEELCAFIIGEHACKEHGPHVHTSQPSGMITSLALSQTLDIYNAIMND